MAPSLTVSLIWAQSPAKTGLALQRLGDRELVCPRFSGQGVRQSGGRPEPGLDSCFAWRIQKPRVGLKSWDIRVYTDAVKIVKVRRVGNSNVVSIPRELEAHGYAPGTSVLVEELDGGELRILPTEQLRERIRTIGERVVAEHPEALKILAEHDPNSKSTPQ